MSPSIIEKIRKLLRLGKNSAATPAESAAALAKALKLAADHGIDLSALPSEDPERGGLTHATEPSLAGLPHHLASNLVQRHFSVKTLFDSTGSKKVIHFIGLETNTQLAVYCYVYVVRAMRQAWRNRTNRRLRDRESFLRGYATAIHSLMPATFHREGLILSLDQYTEAVFFTGQEGVVSKSLADPKKSISAAAFHNGYRAGQDGGIRNAVRGSTQPLLNL